MTEISYTGLYNTSLQLIQEQMQELEEFRYAELTEDNIEPYLLRKEQPVAVLLIGEKVGNPIKLAQRIHALDKYLSIIIINDTQNHQQIKQALLFTPFIGNTLQCVPNGLGAGLANTVKDAVARTRQRRSYARLQGSPEIMRPNTHLYENVQTEYLDKFLQEAPIGALLLNKEGLVMAINRHASQVLQTTEKEILGKPLTNLFPASVQPELRSFIQQTAAGTSIRILQRMQQDQSQHLELRLTEIPLKNSIQYKIGILADITGKVLNQQKIEQQLQALELANRRLQRANTDLDTFVYTASHDLKAPIANIEGLIGLLKQKTGATDSGIAPVFDMIQTSIQRFQATIKDLTEVTHLQKEAEEEVLINVQEVTEEVQTLLHEMIVSTSATIETDFRECSKIRFSRSNFRSIIYNLLSNAIKYRSAQRNPHILIKLENADNSSLLTVQDNGLGISPDKKDKIFTMFKRLHSHVEGTGVGLFIVKRIVDNAEGTIEVEAEEGKGATFKIYLRQSCTS